MGADVNNKLFSVTVRNRKGKSVTSSDPNVISSQLEAAIVALANQMKEGRDRQVAIFKAASVMRKEIKSRVEVWHKDVSRYSNGKKVATYTPGNLQRSIKILSHMKDKKNKYVGVERQPKGGAKGTFAGNRTDGYYAHMVEYKRPYFYPGTIAGREKARQILIDAVKRQISGGS